MHLLTCRTRGLGQSGPCHQHHDAQLLGEEFMTLQDVQRTDGRPVSLSRARFLLASAAGVGALAGLAASRVTEH
jgi:hypothetical protein